MHTSPAAFALPCLLAGLACLVVTPARAGDMPVPDLSAKDGARVAAVTEAASTQLALSAGATPLLSLSAGPLGLAAVAGARLAGTEYADTLPAAKRATVLKSNTAFWSGASVANVLSILALAPPIALVGGVAAGYAAWRHTEQKLADEAARAPAPPPVIVSSPPLADGPLRPTRLVSAETAPAHAEDASPPPLAQAESRNPLH